jgi:hypothetical protein
MANRRSTHRSTARDASRRIGHLSLSRAVLLACSVISLSRPPGQSPDRSYLTPTRPDCHSLTLRRTPECPSLSSTRRTDRGNAHLSLLPSVPHAVSLVSLADPPGCSPNCTSLPSVRRAGRRIAHMSRPPAAPLARSLILDDLPVTPRAVSLVLSLADVLSAVPLAASLLSFT